MSESDIEAKRRAQRKYARSDKGKAAQKRYDQSEKRKANRRKSDRARSRQRREYQRLKQREYRAKIKAKTLQNDDS